MLAPKELDDFGYLGGPPVGVLSAVILVEVPEKRDVVISAFFTNAFAFRRDLSRNTLPPLLFHLLFARRLILF